MFCGAIILCITDINGMWALILSQMQVHINLNPWYLKSIDHLQLMTYERLDLYKKYAI